MTVEERIKGRNVGVIGMARSGIAVARLTLQTGGSPFVSDSRSPEDLAEPCRDLQSAGVLFETGGHTERLLACDYLVVSPGVPLNIEIIQQARQKGLPVFSELEFASWVCPGRIVAITGSNGKTTTTTLVGEILTTGGFDTHVCGNIGRPFADAVGCMTADSIAVVEVSSFQLETVLEFKPHVAAILNLTLDHIDRHGSFEAYREAKYRITENQTFQDVLILNRDDSELSSSAPSTSAETVFFSAQQCDNCLAWVENNRLFTRVGSEACEVIKCDQIAIKGPHNLQNAATAASVAVQFGVDSATIARVLRTFPGVEHRLEKIGSVAGIHFVNDSKATNVDSVRYALMSIDTPLYLIAGGRDKEGDFAPLIDAGRDRVKGIVAIGEAREIVFAALGKAFPVQFAESLEEAVEKCFELAHPGETVLLSPGCASFDMFENYEHRGRAFKAAVAKLKNGKNTDETVAS
ncbi:MAG: UDP-N-acetylmuramoyl-L-alanine--D-glutamate ligase [Candidatus Zixiibacteriota bacterium]|nr:MAG: UDP-N-acetylmuramoyl-L-alanine--D-glutamate ligase [candidate division Zixibacteria bacterium]